MLTVRGRHKSKNENRTFLLFLRLTIIVKVHNGKNQPSMDIAILFGTVVFLSLNDWVHFFTSFTRAGRIFGIPVITCYGRLRIFEIFEKTGILWFGVYGDIAYRQPPNFSISVSKYLTETTNFSSHVTHGYFCTTIISSLSYILMFFKSQYLLVHSRTAALLLLHYSSIILHC